MFRGVVWPGVGVVVCAAALGLATNAVRDRDRIELGRAYFGGETKRPDADGPLGPRLPEVARRPAVESALAARAREEFRVLDGREAAALFGAAGPPDGPLFVDARGAAHFDEAHVPGAIRLDYYNLSEDIGPVEPLLRYVPWLVVYCESDECEDGLLLCRALRDRHGIAAERILLFVGGMREWRELGLPVASGEGR